MSYIAVVCLFEPAADFRLNAVAGTLGEASYLVFILGSGLGRLSAVFVFKPLGRLRFFAYLGRHSMLFYAAHWLILRNARSLIVHCFPDLGGASLALLLLATLALYLAALALVKPLLPKSLLGE